MDSMGRRLSGEPPSRAYVRTRTRYAWELPTKPTPRRPRGGVHKPRTFQPAGYGPPEPVPFKPFTPPRKPFGGRMPRAPLPKGLPGGFPRKALRYFYRFGKPWPLTVILLGLDYFPFGKGYPGAAGYYDLTGWTSVCNIGYPTQPPTYWKVAVFNPGLACSDNDAQVPNGVLGDPIHEGVPGWPVGANRRWLAFGRERDIGSVGRMALNEQWSRSVDIDAEVPWVPPVPPIPPTFDIPFPDPLAPLNPFRLPINRPVPTPRPKPWRMTPRKHDPRQSPDEQPGGSNGSPGLQPWPEIVVKPAPGLPPVFEIPFTPRGPGLPKPGRHSPRLPRPREREVKLVLTPRATSILGRLLSLITESLDLLEVAVKSLPWQLQKVIKGASPYRQLEFVLQNLDKVRPGSFLANLLSENLEDKAFGKLGRIGAKAAREAWNRTGANVRPELGPADTPPGQPREQDPWVKAFDDWMAENVYKFL